jgi:hypothetical protein
MVSGKSKNKNQHVLEGEQVQRGKEDYVVTNEKVSTAANMADYIYIMVLIELISIPNQKGFRSSITTPATMNEESTRLPHAERN